MTQSLDACSLNTWSMGNTWWGGGGKQAPLGSSEDPDSRAHMIHITPPCLLVPTPWTAERTQRTRVMVSGLMILLLTLQWNQRSNDSQNTKSRFVI